MYMRAARAHGFLLGFLPSKVLALCRGEDRIQAYSTKNSPVFGPR